MTNVKHLTPEELAERWNCSGETLARWRSEGQGCRWMRIGGYTVRVPSHGGMSSIDGLPLADASVDDLAFAIQGMESELAHLCGQLTALRRLHHLAGVRGACGTDKVRAILGGGL